MLPALRFIEVPHVGPCVWCGVPTTSAEIEVAELWLCQGSVCATFAARAALERAKTVARAVARVAATRGEGTAP